MLTGRNRVLSGMRPTGKLHLGNYLGALANWVRLQQDHDCFYFVANWHVLTTDPTESGKAPAYTVEMAADWLGSTPSGARCSSSRSCPSTPSFTSCSPW
jgi:tryptophanyl-tRNA synthetase